METSKEEADVGVRIRFTGVNYHDDHSEIRIRDRLEQSESVETVTAFKVECFHCVNWTEDKVNDYDQLAKSLIDWAIDQSNRLYCPDCFDAVKGTFDILTHHLACSPDTIQNCFAKVNEEFPLMTEDLFETVLMVGFGEGMARHFHVSRVGTEMVICLAKAAESCQN